MDLRSLLVRGWDYAFEHRSGALLMAVLATMLVAIVRENWVLFGALVGGGTYLELVHIRLVIQDALVKGLCHCSAVECGSAQVGPVDHRRLH